MKGSILKWYFEVSLYKPVFQPAYFASWRANSSGWVSRCRKSFWRKCVPLASLVWFHISCSVNTLSRCRITELFRFLPYSSVAGIKYNGLIHFTKLCLFERQESSYFFEQGLEQRAFQTYNPNNCITFCFVKWILKNSVFLTCDCGHFSWSCQHANFISAVNQCTCLIQSPHRLCNVVGWNH